MEVQAKHASRTRCRGAAMLLVLFAVAIASILALSFLRSSGPTAAVAANIDRHAEARALAESGLKLAINYVKENDDWRTAMPHGLWLADQGLSGGVFSVYGTDEDGDLTDDEADPLNLSVVATVNGVTHRVSATIVVGASGGGAIGPGIVVGDKIDIHDGCFVDSYDSRLGAYGGSNIGEQAWTVTNSTSNDKIKIHDAGAIRGSAYCGVGGNINAVLDLEGTATVTGTTAALDETIAIPAVTAPSGMPTSLGNRVNSTGTSVINSDLTLDKWTLEGDAIVQISGQVRIYCEGSSGSGGEDDVFLMKGDAEIQLLAGASLTLYVNGEAYITDNARLNANTANPSQLSVFVFGSKDIEVYGDAEIHGQLQHPDKKLDLHGTSQVFGTFIGDTFHLHDSSQMHTDIALSATGESMNGAPQIIVQYTFDQVLVDPVLIGHWRLDDTAGGTGGMIQITDKLTIENGSYLDAYNSSAGAYGGSNRYLDSTFLTNSTGSNDVDLADGTIYGDVQVGSGGNPASVISYSNGAQVTGTTGTQPANVTIPTYDAPSGFGGHTGNQTYDGGSRTWSSDQHFNKLTLEGGARVYVSGDVAVRVSNKLHLKDGEIILNPGATLILWVGHDITIENGSSINNDTQRPGDLTLIQYGNNRNIDLEDGVIVGAVHAAKKLTIENGSAIYGNVIAEDDIHLKDGSIHADIATAPPTPGGVLPLTVAADQSPAANDGAVLGPAGGSTGAIGNAFTFDGVDDYVEIPHISAYALDGGTFSCWFKTDTTSGRQGLFSKDSTGYDTGGHFSVFIESGKVRVRMQSTSESFWVESGTISTDTWYHIMFAWGAGGMVLYLDGVEVDTNVYAGGLSTTSGGAGNFEPIVLGGNAWQSDDLLATPVKDHFRGDIDDLRIYDDRLDNAQALELFNGGEPSARLSEALVQDTSSYGSPLNLSVEDTSRVTWSGGTLTFDQATVAQSMGDAAKVRDAILATGQFSIAARFNRAAPGSTANPSRIVSISSSSGSRNVTVGQEDSTVDVRVRTTVTGSNGTLSPNYETGDVLTSDTSVHAVVTYDGENLRTYVDGALSKTQALTGVLTTWDASMPLLIGNEVGGGQSWLGTIDELAIYDQALSVGQAYSLATGNPYVDAATTVQWDEQD